MVALRDARTHGVLTALQDRSAFVASGTDAASFLHSQLTNDVEGVAVGAGNLTARVERTGHVLALASMHRLADDQFLFVVDQDSPLLDSLDRFLFADQVKLEELPIRWIAIQSAHAADALHQALGPIGFEPWEGLPEFAVRQLRRSKLGKHAEPIYAVRRSLTGEPGFLLGASPETASQLLDALRPIALELGIELAGAGSPVLEQLRIQAGLPRVGPDTTGKRRLLPELGIENRAVSYTKGCYLGQEVIARVRTYGSVPFLLRGLRFPAGTQLPEPGSALSAGGKRAGHMMSHVDAGNEVLAMAYLSRALRTPGQSLELSWEGGGASGTVELLPRIFAANAAERAAWLYDRAIRAFAEGQGPQATRLLEETLSLQPDHRDAYEAIGVILGRDGHFHEAIDVFRRLEEVAPDEPMVNTNLSLYYMKLGDRTTAEEEAAKATLKSMTKQRNQDRSLAEVAAEQQEARIKDAARKRAMFEQVLAFDPEDPIALFGKGRACSVLGEHDEASDLFERALKVDPNNSAVYLAAGRNAEARSDKDLAIETYRKGVEVASRKGDLMPLKEMDHRLLLLGASR